MGDWKIRLLDYVRVKDDATKLGSRLKYELQIWLELPCVPMAGSFLLIDGFEHEITSVCFEIDDRIVSFNTNEFKARDDEEADLYCYDRIKEGCEVAQRWDNRDGVM